MEYAFNTVLFDLDGTLLDSQHGILACMRETLLAFGIKREEKSLYPYLGPPIQDTFRVFFEEPGQVEEATRIYRARYREKGIYDAQIYQGVPELLQTLCAAGISCRVATSKPQVIAADILEHFKLAVYFDHICGVPLHGDGMTKADVIKQALSDLNPSAKAVMVGDRMYDLIGAAACGIKAIGVGYGYGSHEELLAYNPLFICNNAQELCAYLLQTLKEK